MSKGDETYIGISVSRMVEVGDLQRFGGLEKRIFMSFMSESCMRVLQTNRNWKITSIPSQNSCNEYLIAGSLLLLIMRLVFLTNVGAGRIDGQVRPLCTASLSCWRRQAPERQFLIPGAPPVTPSQTPPQITSSEKRLERESSAGDFGCRVKGETGTFGRCQIAGPPLGRLNFTK
jgi:hypothetical protein